MSENPAFTFEFLDKLPIEIRSMIFGYLIRNTIRSLRSRHHQGWEYSHVLDIAKVRAHLRSSPWITLNKQYRAEYLRVFIKQAELRVDITIRGQEIRQSRKEPSELIMLEDCLRIISRRSNVSDFQDDLKEPCKTLHAYLQGISPSHHSVQFEHGYGWAQQRYPSIEATIKQPLNQLRRIHEEFTIPANKISIHISYGSPNTAFSALAYRQPDRGDHYSFKTSLYPIEARIWVADYDASIIAIDGELEMLRRALGEST
jgi:hypothetical protein